MTTGMFWRCRGLEGKERVTEVKLAAKASLEISACSGNEHVTQSITILMHLSVCLTIRVYLCLNYLVACNLCQLPIVNIDAHSVGICPIWSSSSVPSTELKRPAPSYESSLMLTYGPKG